MRRSIEQLRDGVDEALERGDVDEAVRLARESVRRQPDAEGWYLLGVSLLDAGDAEEGEQALQSALELDPLHCDAFVALADEAIARLSFDEGRSLVNDALRVDPLHPVARRLRAALREREGDPDGAARDYLTASLADPDTWPVPTPLDDELIESIAESVLRSLHPTLREYLANVPILVEDMPGLEVLEDLPDAHPFELLGCFTGRSLTERDHGDAWSALPPTITVYRLNLARMSTSREELERELRITLLHEIGHYLGLDEEDLAERGLD